MFTLRRAINLGLTFGLFVVCLAVSADSPTLAQGKGEKRHPVMHKALQDLRDAHKKMKGLKPIYNGHRTKALEHMDAAIHEIHKAIKFVDGDSKK